MYMLRSNRLSQLQMDDVRQCKVYIRNDDDRGRGAEDPENLQSVSILTLVSFLAAVAADPLIKPRISGGKDQIDLVVTPLCRTSPYP